MPKKKSVKKIAQQFLDRAEAIRLFLEGCQGNLSDEHESWVHEYAVIRLYREFEHLILNALVGAINNDTNTLSERSGVAFPKHLTDEVCEFLVIGDGYFDFKGRDGLIATLRKFVPHDHYLVTTAKKTRYKEPLERVCALRNYAAHESSTSKTRAKQATNQHNLGSAGSWLKRQNRFENLVTELEAFANEIATLAPY